MLHARTVPVCTLTLTLRPAIVSSPEMRFSARLENRVDSSENSGRGAGARLHDASTVDAEHAVLDRDFQRIAVQTGHGRRGTCRGLRDRLSDDVRAQQPGQLLTIA